MQGVTIYLWHEGKWLYDEVQWHPRHQLNRARARVLALEALMGDPTVSHVRVDYELGQFEQAVRSVHGFVRLLTDAEKNRLSLDNPVWPLTAAPPDLRKAHGLAMVEKERVFQSRVPSRM